MIRPASGSESESVSPSAVSYSFRFPGLAHQASLSMKVSRHASWSGLPFSPPRDLPDPGIQPGSPALLLLLSCFSHVRLCATPWMAAHQALPSLGFSRQEHWSGVPLPSPSCIAGRFFTVWATKEVSRRMMFKSRSLWLPSLLYQLGSHIYIYIYVASKSTEKLHIYRRLSYIYKTFIYMTSKLTHTHIFCFREVQ